VRLRASSSALRSSSCVKCSCETSNKAFQFLLHPEFVLRIGVYVLAVVGGGAVVFFFFFCLKFFFFLC
jgi:hypothetical protein